MIRACPFFEMGNFAIQTSIFHSILFRAHSFRIDSSHFFLFSRITFIRILICLNALCLVKNQKIITQFLVIIFDDDPFLLFDSIRFLVPQSTIEPQFLFSGAKSQSILFSQSSSTLSKIIRSSFFPGLIFFYFYFYFIVSMSTPNSIGLFSHPLVRLFFGWLSSSSSNNLISFY